MTPLCSTSSHSNLASLIGLEPGKKKSSFYKSLESDLELSVLDGYRRVIFGSYKIYICCLVYRLLITKNYELKTNG